eukprot:TRINITY_DN63436_c0_g1_i1.p1 TRINITY_DN63436_c0_g1~~TRINITY_DN63436_c0_g1_i1.p1  ORF type:complete len:651 (+),score=109.40 TRINITY_DN63436_c0_g1_i1:36-1955(+)
MVPHMMERFREFKLFQDIFGSGASCQEKEEGLKKVRRTRTRDLDNDERRIRMDKMLQSGMFGSGMFIVLMSNLYLAIYETDYRAQHGDKDLPHWVNALGSCFLLLYVAELGVRVFVYRVEFLSSMSNTVDAGIILLEVAFASVLVSWEIPSAGPLRMFRLVRLLRAVRVMRHFRELYMMSFGMAGAFKAIIWASILISVSLLIFAIIAVELLHPINVEVAATGEYDDCSRCPRAFESVSASLLTFTQQIIAGDSWGRVSVPIIEMKPVSGFIFLCLIVVVNLGLMNLVLTVIVDSAAEARERDVYQKALDKEREFSRAKAKLTNLCHDLDTNMNGSLTLPELVNGFNMSEDFRNTLRMMDAKKEDLPMIFSILDKDSSGDVTPEEFVEQIHRLKTQDLHTLVVFIWHSVNQITEVLRHQFQEESNGSHDGGNLSGAIRSIRESVRAGSKEMKSPVSSQALVSHAVQQVPSMQNSTEHEFDFKKMSEPSTAFELAPKDFADPVPLEEALPAHQRPISEQTTARCAVSRHSQELAKLTDTLLQARESLIAQIGTLTDATTVVQEMKINESESQRYESPVRLREAPALFFEAAALVVDTPKEEAVQRRCSDHAGVCQNGFDAGKRLQFGNREGIAADRCVTR